MNAPRLPKAGQNRFWVIEHQPNKKTAPVRIELRERSIKDHDKNLKSLSRLISYGETVADSEKVYEEATAIIVRAGHIDRFVGTWNGED